MKFKFLIFLFIWVVLTVVPSLAEVHIWPDYLGITLPPNIAPLNFKLVGTGSTPMGTDPKSVGTGPKSVGTVPKSAGTGPKSVGTDPKSVGTDPGRAVLTAADGSQLAVKADQQGIVRWPLKSWRRFIAAHAGESVLLSLSVRGEKLVVTNHIAQAAIDSHLTYRLIPPSYVNYHRLGLYQRDLTSFEERPIYRNCQLSRSHCINCHTPNRAKSDEFLFHVRKNFEGTVVVSPKWGRRKLALKAKGLPARGTYPAWHPSGDFICFSFNETRQMFYLDDPDMIEVMDFQSDLALYSFSDGTITPIENEPLAFETFPTWSPDGHTLYSVRTRAPGDHLPEDYKARSDFICEHAQELRYDLVARDFDPQTRRLSSLRRVVDTQGSHRSITFPRVSPDGRWLVMTVGPYGNFHVWHRTADLWIVDLSGAAGMRPLDELNSPQSESYHTFSRDGRWMVFSSRREDGAYTRPCFAHFDPTTGRFGKPFILPVENPNDHVERLLSYNVPEFSAGWVAVRPGDLRKLVEAEAN